MAGSEPVPGTGTGAAPQTAPAEGDFMAMVPAGLRDQLQAVLDSPGYRLAEADADFLASPDLRGLRLQLEYEKIETQLRAHAIAHTIVVFGSARISDPEPIRHRLEAIGRELSRLRADDPGHVLLSSERSQLERRLVQARYYDIARRFAYLASLDANRALQRDVQRQGGKLPGAVAAARRLVIMTGGGPGVMEAANRGAFDAGSPSVGLNISLPHEQFPNPYVTPALCMRFHYFALRKLHFMQRARALVAFPGGFGTMDELFETLTLIQTRKIAPTPVVLVGHEFWQQAINLDFLVDQAVISPEDRSLFSHAETAEEIWAKILNWYDERGTPLIASD